MVIKNVWPQSVTFTFDLVNHMSCYWSWQTPTASGLPSQPWTYIHCCGKYHRSQFPENYGICRYQSLNTAIPSRECYRQVIECNTDMCMQYTWQHSKNLITNARPLFMKMNKEWNLNRKMTNGESWTNVSNYAWGSVAEWLACSTLVRRPRVQFPVVSRPGYLYLTSAVTVKVCRPS